MKLKYDKMYLFGFWNINIILFLDILLSYYLSLLFSKIGHAGESV